MTLPSMARKTRIKPLPPLAGQYFKTVTALEDEIRKILKTYVPLDTPVIGCYGELLTAYMKTHESMAYQEERSGPLMHVEIRFNPAVRCPKPEDRRQVWCVFSDGYAAPFSYKVARSNHGVIETGDTRSKMHKTWICRAGRCLIEPDIIDYRQVILESSGVCELSGEPLSRLNADVHHQGLSFQWLLFTFVKNYCFENSYTLKDIEVVDTNTYGSKKFALDVLNEDWIQFHSANADLVCVTKDEHYKLHKNMPAPNWSELF